MQQEIDATFVFETLLSSTLLNFEACSAPDHVVDSIRTVIDGRPFINHQGAITKDDRFVPAYRDMLRTVAQFIVTDTHLKRALLLHDVVMAMRFRLRPVFRILFPDQEEDKYNT
jgi:hypothetical protein